MGGLEASGKCPWAGCVPASVFPSENEWKVAQFSGRVLTPMAFLSHVLTNLAEP